MRNEFTLRLLEQAGISEGMHVLDVGCGPGEVTTFIRERVGDTGSVTGIDVNQQLLDIARSQNQFDNVAFLNRDIYHLEELGTYDAIVGRRVLMYLPDAVKAIKALAQHLTTGGVMAFQESDALNSGYGGDAFPLHQLALKRVLQTIEHEGGNIHIGQQLYGKFVESGFESPHVMSEVVVQSTTSSSDLYWLTEMMHQRMIQHRVIDESLDLALLKAQMEQELNATNAAFIRDVAFGVWSVKA
ncbi:methyltransferase domain-containing protein [Staphylococcus coagulans]|uniref:methyltransferase domain-containing protein n=1 Tax=Staphylococcus coagulans TaxID=74706 RepID=UPI001C70CF71|nr:methyltransferase domain-containing protein [Staphylococcus coagulans]